MKLTQMTLLVAFGGVALPGLIIGAADYRAEARELRQALAEQMETRVRSLAVSLRLPVWQVDEQTARGLLDAQFEDPRIVSALVVEGSDDEPGGSQVLARREQPERAGGELVTLHNTIESNGLRIGEVSLSYSTAGLQDHLATERNDALVTGAAQVSTAWLLLGMLLYWRLVLPVRRLQRQAEQLSANRLDTPVEWQGFDEIGLVGRHLDEARESLRTSTRELQLASQAYENAREGILIAAAGGAILHANHVFCAQYGLPRESLAGRDLFEVILRDPGPAMAELRQAIEAADAWEGRSTAPRADGGSYPAFLRIGAVRAAGGALSHLVASCTDIQRQVDAAERIRFLAYCNPLSGLPNRVALEEHVNGRLAVLPAGRRLAFLDMDMDRFKHVNESYGHTVGDLLLAEMARHLHETCESRGVFLAHIGGDEFVLVLECDEPADATDFCQLLLRLFARPFEVQGIDFVLSPSIGIALCPDDGTSFLALQQNADAAMYSAKSRGGAAFARYDSEEHARTQEFLLIETHLRHAIARGELAIQYQPQFEAHTLRLTGFEALLRWRQRDIGPVSPAKFIPVAEASGLIVPIGDWVLEQAASQLASWSAAGLAVVPVAVNISSVQIRHGELVTSVRHVLELSGVRADLLKLEITESSVMEDDAATNRCIEQLNALGVRLSIDDFGTGYSNLKHLRRFRFDQLKLDQSFVRGLPDSAEDTGLIRAMIGMARSMGLRTIAEGVETDAQMRFLREAGCDEVQGFLLGRPGGIEQAHAPLAPPLGKGQQA